MSDHYPDGTPLPNGWTIKEPTPLLNITSSVMPLSVVFDVVAYLQGHEEPEMFELLGKLKDFLA